MKRIQIPRDLYVERLMARRMNGFVKVLTGIRRCGKSYLLGTLFRDRLVAEGVAADHIVAVDLDDRKHVALRDPLRLDAYVRGKVRRGKRPYYVFIDEIQRSIKVPAPGVDLASVAPEDRDDAFVTFYDVLNGWRNLENVDVYVTGSNSKTLSSDIATNFRDRGQQIRVWPLSFTEWLPVSGLVDKMEAFHRYLTWGGMPVAALTDDPDERSDYLKGLFDEVYLKDIRERHGIKEDLVLANLIDVLASDIGSLTNPHKVGDTMDSLWKIRPSDHTLKNYIEYLEDAFLFGHARRFEVKGRRCLESPVKYYATDLGLRNARPTTSFCAADATSTSASFRSRRATRKAGSRSGSTRSTSSSTAAATRSTSSPPCGWTTRRRSAARRSPCARPATSSRRSSSPKATASPGPTPTESSASA